MYQKQLIKEDKIVEVSISMPEIIYKYFQSSNKVELSLEAIKHIAEHNNMLIMNMAEEAVETDKLKINFTFVINETIRFLKELDNTIDELYSLKNKINSNITIIVTEIKKQSPIILSRKNTIPDTTKKYTEISQLTSEIVNYIKKSVDGLDILHNSANVISNMILDVLSISGDKAINVYKTATTCEERLCILPHIARNIHDLIILLNELNRMLSAVII